LSEFLTTVGAITAALLSVLAFGQLATRIYRRTVGRRITARSKLARLAVNTRFEYFQQMLGQPAFQEALGEVRVAEKRAVDGIRYTFIDPDFYVVAHVRKDEFSVFMYSVTSRNAKIRPRGPAHLSGIRLGTATFAHFQDSEEWNPSSVAGCLGAHTYGYSEVYYFGYPGLYQHFALGHSQMGLPGATFPPGTHEIFHGDGLLSNGVVVEESSGYERALRDGRLHRLRRALIVNTYAVSAPGVILDGDPLGFGPSETRVGVLHLIDVMSGRRLGEPRFRYITRRIQESLAEVLGRYRGRS
jgi:hypothetical protein